MSAAQVPAALMDLLEKDALGHLATVRADGTPHVTPLWVDHDANTVLVNVRLDRVKAANMRERPSVAISIVDPRNPYRYLAITGRVVSWSEDGWQEHMNSLSRRYMKVDPDNRLVADALEAEWNEKLRLHADAAADYERRSREEAASLDADARRRILDLAEQPMVL